MKRVYRHEVSPRHVRYRSSTHAVSKKMMVGLRFSSGKKRSRAASTSSHPSASKRGAIPKITPHPHTPVSEPQLLLLPRMARSFFMSLGYMVATHANNDTCRVVQSCERAPHSCEHQCFQKLSHVTSVALDRRTAGERTSCGCSVRELCRPRPRRPQTGSVSNADHNVTRGTSSKGRLRFHAGVGASHFCFGSRGAMNVYTVDNLRNAPLFAETELAVRQSSFPLCFGG